MVVSKWLKKFESFTPFTEAEAWGLFRLAAFAEAVGWMLLISGILIQKYLTPRSDIPVLLAGHTHGILFLIYITSAVVFYPSQGWSRRRTLAACVASVPPFGSLMFEQWASHKRRHARLSRTLYSSAFQAILAG